MSPLPLDQPGWGANKGIRRCGLCHREDREWEEAEEKGEDRIHPDGEEAWAEVVASALEAAVSARTADTRFPMNGGLPVLKSNAPIVGLT